MVDPIGPSSIRYSAPLGEPPKQLKAAIEKLEKELAELKTDFFYGRITLDQFMKALSQASKQTMQFMKSTTADFGVANNPAYAGLNKAFQAINNILTARGEGVNTMTDLANAIAGLADSAQKIQT